MLGNEPCDANMQANPPHSVGSLVRRLVEASIDTKLCGYVSVYGWSSIVWTSEIKLKHKRLVLTSVRSNPSAFQL